MNAERRTTLSVQISAFPRDQQQIELLAEGIASPLPSLATGIPAAVLFIPAGGRLFAATFGQGRHLLAPESIEMDFGLRVTLNTVDPTKLRSLDVRTFEEHTRHSRLQLSRSSSVEAFGVDISRDLLKAVTGEPRDTTLAKRLTGKDALVLTGPINLLTLAARCERLLKEFQSKEYLKHFPWVDNIQAVRDSALVSQLDSQLVTMLSSGQIGKTHLAPPEMIDWAREQPEYLYPGERSTKGHPDLDLAECLDTLARLVKAQPHAFAPTPDSLKQQKIRVIFDDGGGHMERWSVYDCLVSEVTLGGALYALSAGQWFRIETQFVKEIEQRVSTLAKTVPDLPEADAGKPEKAYNLKAAHSPAFAHLDEQLVKCAGARTPIEACDLFSRDRQFIHVKRKTRSSTLSHLFSQGVVSAEAFLRDEQFRAGVKALVEQRGPALAPLLNDRS